MKKALVYTLLGVVVLGGTGTFLYLNKKKKKSEEDSASDGSTNKTTSGNGILYYGINATQTKTLQSKLNDFIASGKLGDVMGLLGRLGELGASTTATREFIFVKNADDSISYRYRTNAATPWSSWCKYLSWCPNDGGNKAYSRWVQDGMPIGVAYPISGGDGIVDNTTSAAATTKSNTVDVPVSSGNAIEQFKAAIQPSLTNNALKVDGAYGKNTMAVVAALQLYLNATKNAGLQVDGKYGPKTDAVTGWGIAGLGDLGRKGKKKGRGRRKKKADTANEGGSFKKRSRKLRKKRKARKMNVAPPPAEESQKITEAATPIEEPQEVEITSEPQEIAENVEVSGIL